MRRETPNKFGYMKYDIWIFVTATWIKHGIHIFIAYGFSTHSTVESHIFEICVNVRHCSPKISYNCLCKCVTKIESLVFKSLETKRYMNIRRYIMIFENIKSLVGYYPNMLVYCYTLCETAALHIYLFLQIYRLSYRSKWYSGLSWFIYISHWLWVLYA